ncbi:unnamed protein product, partial [Porites lobata]
DINECTTKVRNCDANAFCDNTEGSYNCACCPGYTGNGISCADKLSRHLLLKLEGTGGRKLCRCSVISLGLHLNSLLSDINECTANVHNCDDNAFCNNTEGSYKCTCSPGYDGNGTSCTDIKECTTNVHNCDANAFCNNTQGSYNCTCSPGYTGNGTSCIGKSSCLMHCTANVHNCDANAFCNNTQGFYNCTCSPGYTGNGTSCIDINECTANVHNCNDNAFCSNTEGSYKCTCSPGYDGNGTSCTDIKECTTNVHNCDANAFCNNTQGSYNCTCSPGYTGNGTSCIGKSSCLMHGFYLPFRYNECTSKVHNCDNANAFCITFLSDINECTTNVHKCDANAFCNNTDGSYNCTCSPGFTGNGTACTG